MGLSSAFLWPQPAVAACRITGETAVCTGDLSAGVEFINRIETLTVEDLTTNITPDADRSGIVVDNLAGTDQSAAGVTITFSGGDFGINTSNFGIIGESEGGQGRNGGRDSRAAGDATGGSGRGGGTGGSSTLTFESGFVSGAGPSDFSVAIQSGGGFGGNGGEGVTDAGFGRGGRGGAGGIADIATVTVTTGRFTVPGNSAQAFTISSEGGQGGMGGEGRSGAGSTRGGDGGDGGASRGATLSLGTPDVTLDRFSATGIAVGSAGGGGGDGGRAESDTAGSSRGGSGGSGGTGGAVSVTVDAGVYTQNGSGDLLFVTSTGGTGGNGAEGRTDVVADSRGGTGGRGGAGGMIGVALNGGNFTVGSDGDAAIFVQSRGNDGGDGGEGRTDVAAARADGGNAGAGGDGAVIDVTSTAPGFSIKTTSTSRSQHGLRIESLGGSGGKGGEGRSQVFGDGFGGDGGVGGGGGFIFLDLIGSIETSGPRAQGLFARSYGGEGGDGGSGNATAGTGRGGASLGGGPSGRSTATFTGRVLTRGDEANGIIIQSVGGFSGDAGSSSGFLAYGASEQSAGDGATVEFTLDEGSRITTEGDDAAAIIIQSVGGGGGRGSSEIGIAALGGRGSAGGRGGEVVATFRGSVETRGGQRSRALHVASRGGGGGDAGASAGITAIGGSGGTGGDGGEVAVRNNANLITAGEQSDALYAATVGGGGGSAHSTVGVVAIGGSGGRGGSGGNIFSSSLGIIETSGADADGIFMHSIGGGGGDGSNAVSVSGGFSFAVGGRGGDGGNGGKVIFNNGAVTDFFSITTEGDRARGFLAQSVGGGGGDGGNAISVSGSPTLDISFGASGSGGHAGDGSEVSVAIGGGDITTSGSNAPALQAQSTGGGGGSGGTTVSSANGSLALTLAVGGAGGGGGAGGIASVGNTGKLTTTGDSSPGLIAHSTGGGGGHSGTTVAGSTVDGFSLGLSIGGSAGGGGAGGNTEVVGTGDIETSGNVSPGLYVHSVGGGGGYSGTSVAASGIAGAEISASVGGRGGNGGGGGSVTVDVQRTISTKGDASPGLTGLSIGGGGGHSGVTVSGALSSQTSIDASVGGSGGDGGTAGTVSVTTTEAISTEGHSSAAITAHSSGGGGGSSHFTGSFSGVSSGSVNASVGGRGGAAGDGGQVTVTTDGDLGTRGHNAPGISAMSIGGGGGDSGVTVSGALASGTGIGVSVGGDGGSSGSGGKVTVASTSTISTQGTHSVGIRAKSIARSGGNAGTVVTGTAVSGGTVGVSVGGSGGSGGNSADVMVTSRGGVTTAGAYASAITAQSIAAGGGSAKGTVTASGLSLGNFNVTVGGNGGSGGTAGNVAVDSSGALKTTTHHAFGILAQSHGGAGGGGGFAAEGGFTAGEVSGQLAATVGGSGGSGGAAGAVMVEARTSIETADYGAIGILAQSIGGNGGDGGNVYTGNLNFSTDGSSQVDIDIGGSGGSGATAAVVRVNNDASITTTGYLAEGIVAQSIGGNGGNGGNTYSVIGGISASATANVELNIGGTGGTGAFADTAGIVNNGEITTSRGGATALRAQSIGGGGGRGGSAASINLRLPSRTPSGTSVNANISMQVGGDGGNGNDGGDASVVNNARITTEGNSAKGVIAHSVGGGGGDGGPASSFAISFAGACTLARVVGAFNCSSATNPSQTTQIRPTLTAVIGGDGAGGGDAGTASVQNEGDISTRGSASHAIVAHSHGGGGGNGADGDLGLVGWTTNQTAEEIARLGTTFTTLPSLTNISISVGGSAGAAGDGGEVNVRSLGLAKTSGAHAFGVHAQSVGGGGGNAGAGISGLWSVATVGGRGSGGGDGGSVTVAPPFIETEGEGSVGVFAQSVGGGGGTAGDVEEAFIAPWADLNIGVGVGVQEAAGAGGNGGSVTVNADGTIATKGAKAHGIVAQSVGGSGGIAGITGLVEGANINNFAGSAGDAGNSGDIDVIAGGPVTVSGRQAHGIVAQSVSGSGSSDTSGMISIMVAGPVTASGEDGRAILAQSASANGRNNAIQITIAEGVTVMTAANGAETIGLFDGRDNTIVNRGALLQDGGSDGEGHVIRTNGTAALSVQNFGQLEGSVLSERRASGGGAGASPEGIAIANESGATFGLGSEVDLGGTAGQLTNNGRISAGTAGTTGASIVHSQLVQEADGETWVDFAFAGGNDLIIIDAPASGRFAGSVRPNPIGGKPKSGDSGRFTFLTSTGSLESTDLTVKPTATVDYSLLRITGSGGDPEVQLSFSVDYTPWNGDSTAQARVPDSLRTLINDNHTRFGEHVDALIDADPGGSAGAFIEDLALLLLTIEDVETLVDTYDRFAPAEIFATTDAAHLSSLRFSDSLNSCPEVSAAGAVTFTRQGSCIWLQAGGGGVDRQRSGTSTDYDETFYGLSVGGQAELNDGVFLGAALAYEHTDLSNTRVDGDGNRFQAGAIVKKQFGTTTVSASLSGGIGNYDLSRSVPTAGGDRIAHSSPDTSWIAAHARIERVFEPRDNLYVKPWLDVGVNHLRQDAFQETGAGGFGLDVAAYNQTLVTLNPMLEFGTTFAMFNRQAKASAAAGVLATVSGTDQSTQVRFLGAGPAGPTFTVSSESQRIFADLGANLEIKISDKSIFSIAGQALLSDDQQEYGAAGRLRFFF